MAGENLLCSGDFLLATLGLTSLPAIRAIERDSN